MYNRFVIHKYISFVIIIREFHTDLISYSFKFIEILIYRFMSIIATYELIGN